MSTYTRVASLAVIIALAACRDELDVGMLAATPLGALRGVTVGMTVAELTKARPDAAFNPYRGFHETINGMAVAYDFEAGSADKASIRQQARLEAILLTRPAASEDRARKEWSAAVDSASAAYGAPWRCEAIMGASAGIRAVWRINGVFLEIAARRLFAMGTEVIPSRVVFRVSREEKPNDLLNVTKTECPTAESKARR